MTILPLVRRAGYAIAFCTALFSAGSVADSHSSKEEGKKLDEAKLLRGDLWSQMTTDHKLAYLWGLYTVVEVERQLALEFPNLKVENFSTKAAEGDRGMTLHDLQMVVDDYYAKNPTQQDVSVIRVLWDETIVPNIKTGINGRPLPNR